jgi:uncharacterized protein (DUF2235 family)
LALSVANRDGSLVQVAYYDQGVGTGNVLDRLTGGAFGAGLEENIHDAYRFLLSNYELGDEIFLFGFSRGAYTARSIAGMIRKCGILRRDQIHRYREALALYRSEHHPDSEVPVRFRRECSLAGEEIIPIRFVGVWDTVGALGIPLSWLRWLTRRDHQFHDTELSRAVQSAYHALAIDERRRPFAPTLWSYRPKTGQTVEQTWFCGAHSDVGGGYAERGLSDIALGWMKAKARQEGLVFDPRAEQAYPSMPDAAAAIHNSRVGIYRITTGLDRTIGFDEKTGVADDTQRLHESVLARWDSDASYRPASLHTYFKRMGDARSR